MRLVLSLKSQDPPTIKGCLPLDKAQRTLVLIVPEGVDIDEAETIEHIPNIVFFFFSNARRFDLLGLRI